MDERDVDARFASIVARWEGPVPDADGARDEREADAADRASDEVADAASGGATTPQGGAAAGDGPDAVPPESVPTDAAEPPAPSPAPRSPWVNPSPLDVVVPPTAWRASEPSDPATEAAAADAETALDDGHFEPPPVDLPPQEDLHFWGAVIGLVAGPLMLLYVVFARPFHSTRWFVASVLVSLVGFTLLVLRQPSHRDPTSGDDGARV
jgi:hypothetical protein